MEIGNVCAIYIFIYVVYVRPHFYSGGADLRRMGGV